MKREGRGAGRAAFILFSTQRTWKYTPMLSIAFDPWSWVTWMKDWLEVSTYEYLSRRAEDKSCWFVKIDKTNFPVNLSDWRRACQMSEARTSFEDVEPDIGRVWTASYRASLHQIALIYVCQRRCNVERAGKNYCFLNIRDSSWLG